MKKLLFLQIIFCFSTMVHAQVTNGLIAYYPFNGNANDASGHNHNGTNNNAVLAADRFGAANSAYSFNGTNARIEIPDHSDFHVTNFTISAWVNVTNTTSQTIVSKSFGGSYFNSYAIGYWHDNNSLSVAITDGVTSGGYFAGVSLLPNWFHYVVSYNDQNNAIKFYENGNLVATAATNITLGYDNNIITIGCEYEDGAVKFPVSGLIDDVRIYNRTLTQSEIDTLANPLPYASIADKSMAEGNSGTSLMKFKVTLNHAYDTTVKIKYATADSTAAAGSDYVTQQGTIKFNAGVTSKNISITINGDLTHESNERFKVILTNPTNAILLDSLAIGTIKNDDAALTESTTQASDNLIDRSTRVIFPNPANDVIHITGLTDKNYAIEIIDKEDKTVIRQIVTSKNNSINISNLSPGNYFIRFAGESAVQTIKFVKL